MRIEHENLTDGQRVYVALAYIGAGVDTVNGLVKTGVVENAEAKLIRLDRGGFWTLLPWEVAADTEADAHAHIAEVFEAAAAKLNGIAAKHRDEAAGVAAKAAVIYA